MANKLVKRPVDETIHKQRALLLKAFTVVEWVVGEGKLLEYPYFDADDLLIELAEFLDVQDSEHAQLLLKGAEL